MGLKLVFHKGVCVVVARKASKWCVFLLLSCCNYCEGVLSTAIEEGALVNLPLFFPFPSRESTDKAASM